MIRRKQRKLRGKGGNEEKERKGEWGRGHRDDTDVAPGLTMLDTRLSAIA